MKNQMISRVKLFLHAILIYDEYHVIMMVMDILKCNEFSCEY